MLGDGGDARMHPGTQEQVAPPNQGFHFMRVEFLLQQMHPGMQGVLNASMDLSACDQVAFIVFAGSKNMGHKHDMDAMPADKVIDQVVHQPAIIRPDPEHVIVRVSPNEKKTADVQSHQGYALV
jgi:hypothetical protein